MIIICAWSCKNHDAMELKNIEVEDANTVSKPIASDFTEIDLISQKLQEYYDLSVLQQQFPELEKELTSQIKTLSNSEASLNTDSNISIKNVSQIGNSKQLSDSITELVLKFEIHSKKRTQIDTITALVKTSKITIDNEEFTTRKIEFKD
jgi:hypothetical protein